MGTWFVLMIFRRGCFVTCMFLRSHQSNYLISRVVFLFLFFFFLLFVLDVIMCAFACILNNLSVDKCGFFFCFVFFMVIAAGPGRRARQYVPWNFTFYDDLLFEGLTNWNKNKASGQRGNRLKPVPARRSLLGRKIICTHI